MKIQTTGLTCLACMKFGLGLGMGLLLSGAALAQKDFSLNKALTMANDYQYKIPEMRYSSTLAKTIEKFLHQLSKPALG